MYAKDVIKARCIWAPRRVGVCCCSAYVIEENRLPVVNDLENTVGVVSESDFLRRTEIGTKRQRSRWVEFFMGPGRLADEYVQFAGRKIGDVMTHDVRTTLPARG